MDATATPAFGASTSSLPQGENPRRWLHVVSHTDPRYGGLSAAVPALAASLGERAGIDVSLAAFCHAGEQYLPSAIGRDDVTFWPTSRASWAMKRELRTNFAELVRQADGLHIHGIWEESTAVACRLARKLGKPYVLSAHGMLEPWALSAKRLKKRVYAALIERENVAGAACLHALTAAEAVQYRRFGATCPIAVVPNAVDLPEDAHGDVFLDHFPQLRGKRLVLFLSRLHPKKGLHLLVESWARVCKQYPDAHLVIAGPDADGMHARLMEQVRQLGLDGQVCFTGMLAGAMKWSVLDAAECYVLPSYSEGLSMALLEAMGMGVPVIATRACNMPEITAADAGWEIEASVDALTGALASLLGAPAEKNWAKGRNGARLIASQYSTAQVTQGMAELYDYLLGGPEPASTPLLLGGAQ